MTTTATAADAYALFRDTLGRFLPGNPGGPGNAVAREMAELRQRFRRSVPEHTFQFIVERLLDRCMAGHLPAMKLFFDYYLGKPDASIDADRLPLHELALALEGARLCEAARRAGLAPEAPPPPPALPPPGRPEEEWRRPRRERRGGGTSLDDAIGAMIQAVNACRPATAKSMPDPPAPPARRRKSPHPPDVTAPCH